MAQVILKMTDLAPTAEEPFGQLEVECTTSDDTDTTSSANVMAAFLKKYWPILMSSAGQEYQQALAEAANKPVETAPKLVGADGQVLNSEDAGLVETPHGLVDPELGGHPHD